jgi:hypothetical protein
MSFTKALYNRIKTVSGLTNIYYGTANNKTPPYYVMLTVSESGQGSTLCEDQGQAGRLQVQFSCSGGTGAGSAEEALETLRTFVIAIIGNIIYSGSTYEVWENVTTGVRPIGGASLNTWDAIFESTLNWRKI